MKNSNDTSWDRTSDLPICSTAPWPLNHHGPRSDDNVLGNCGVGGIDLYCLLLKFEKIIKKNKT